MEGVAVGLVDYRAPATVSEGGNNCCNPHTQQEEDEDEPQQSDVDSDDLVGEESD